MTYMQLFWFMGILLLGLAFGVVMLARASDHNQSERRKISNDLAKRMGQGMVPPPK